MVTPTPDPPAIGKPGGWQRWRGPALFASFCLNLFLVGLMIGGAVPPHHRPHWFGRAHLAGEPPAPPPRDIAREPGRPGMPGLSQGMSGGPGGGALAFRQAIQSLPESDRRVFEAAMEDARPEIVRQQRDLRQARQRIGEIVRAEPFDRQAALKALEEVRQRQQAIQQRLHAGTVEALAKLPADSRRQFADALAQRVARP
jgi:uncharacterized membrane protein